MTDIHIYTLCVCKCIYTKYAYIYVRICNQSWKLCHSVFLDKGQGSKGSFKRIIQFVMAISRSCRVHMVPNISENIYDGRMIPPKISHPTPNNISSQLVISPSYHRFTWGVSSFFSCLSFFFWGGGG